MASISKLLDKVARVTGRPFSEMQLYGRRLREAGFLAEGAPGRAPMATHRDLASIVVAVMATDISNRAGLVAEEYSGVVETLEALLKDEWFREHFMWISCDRTEHCFDILVMATQYIYIPNQLNAFDRHLGELIKPEIASLNRLGPSEYLISSPPREFTSDENERIEQAREFIDYQLIASMSGAFVQDLVALVED